MSDFGIRIRIPPHRQVTPPHPIRFTYSSLSLHAVSVDNRIRISYILEKAVATLGSIGLMIVITEHYVLPTLQPILPSQTIGMTFTQKLLELGWVLMDMIFPFITLYLLAFYVIFECVLNVFAEVTRFADRGFYDAWWNSTTWDQVLFLSPPLLSSVPRLPQSRDPRRPFVDGSLRGNGINQSTYSSSATSIIPPSQHSAYLKPMPHSLLFFLVPVFMNSSWHVCFIG